MPLFERSADPEPLRRVRAWARELWATGDATVSVAQLQCVEPGCPPHETVVLISPGAGRRTIQHKLAKPAGDITFEDLQALADLDPQEPSA